MKIKNFNDYSIKTKIFTLSIVQIILPVLVIGVLSFVVSNRILYTQSFSHAKSLFEFVSGQVTDCSDDIFNISQDILYDRDIYGITALGNNITNENIAKINNLISAKSELEAVSLTLGNHEFRTEQRKNDIPPVGSVGYIQLLENARQKSNGIYWHTGEISNGACNIFFVRIIYNPYTYRETGNIIFQVPNDIFFSIVEKYADSTERGLELISPLNSVIFKSNNPDMQISPAELSAANAKPDTIFKLGKTYLIYRNIPRLDWSVVCITSSRSLTENSVQLMIYIILLCIISTMLLLFFTGYINNNISHPLYKLANTMTHWNEDRSFENLYADRKDEIGVLYKSFSLMVDKINRLINQDYRNKLLVKESELKMLQSQISPHFLFNTLSVINNIAILNDVPQIGEIVTALSDILNQSIGRSNSLLSLTEELSYADSYIYIQNVRFNGKFHVIKDLAPETENILIPCLTIQPIVENAIKHGLIPMPSDCILTIKAYLEGDDLVVTVSDNGIGIDEKTLAETNTLLKNNAPSINGSVGLVNVNKRLILLYGNEYHITIDSCSQKYTTVYLRFKYTDRKHKNDISEV